MAVGYGADEGNAEKDACKFKSRGRRGRLHGGKPGVVNLGAVVAKTGREEMYEDRGAGLKFDVTSGVSDSEQ